MPSADNCSILDQSKIANPMSIIPFKRDPDFVEPEGLLDQIHQKCTVPGSWTALVGIGGTGLVQTEARRLPLTPK
jgi:hypothetical protein